MPADFLLIIGDREPLGWILTEEVMAFSAHRSRQVALVEKGDRLFLYTTRGCFHSPNKDRGRIIGEATVATPISTLDVPVKFGESEFPIGCELRIDGLVPRSKGLLMNDLVKDLHLFPNQGPKSWGVQLRRVLAPIDKHDANILHKKLERVVKPLSQTRSEYLSRTSFAHPPST